MNENDDKDIEPENEVGSWLAEIDRAERDMKKYLDTCKRVEKRYLYESSSRGGRRQYAMLWANTEVLKPSIYAKRPSPAVQSRFKTNDPTARLAGMLLERGLDFQFDVCDYDASFKSIRDDYLLFARGACRLRYEATFNEIEIADGDNEDDDAPPEQTIAFETVKLDFIDRRDFIHPTARRWEELPWICYRAFLTKDKIEKRFGKECADKIAYDAKKEKSSLSDDNSSEGDKTTIYEIWDKDSKEVLWLCKSYPEILERGPPYLKLDGFYPSPKPAYGTLATDKLTPRPDYVFYQDQAEEIDDLTARIGALTDSLKLVGFYPAGPQGEGVPEIERAVAAGFENRMIAVKSWDAFRQGGGSGAPIVWLPVEQVAKIIEACIKLRKELVADVFQITGIADIMRGDSDAEETAAAQGLKAQWGSIRLRERQKELARVARDVTRLAAEIISNHFQVSTLCQIADMKIPTDADVQQMQAQFASQQMAQAQQQAQTGTAMPPGGPITGGGGGSQGGLPSLGAAGQAGPPPAPMLQMPDPGPTQEQIEQLLRDNAHRRFAIDIEADSTIAADEAGEQKRRTDLIDKTGKFLVAMFPLIRAEPAIGPFVGQMFLFGLRSFPAARELEAEAEKMIDKMLAQAGQPKPPGPEVMEAQAANAKSQAEIAKAKIGMQTEQMRAQAEIQNSQIDAQASLRDNQAEIQSHQMEMQRMNAEHQMMQAEHAAKQKTLAQTVLAAEQKFAARDALSMFKTGSKQ